MPPVRPCYSRAGIKGLKLITGFIQVLCEGLGAMKTREFAFIQHVRQARTSGWLLQCGKNSKRGFDKGTALGNLLAASVFLPLFKRFANSFQTAV